jgi:hypothetical protein
VNLHRIIADKTTAEFFKEIFAFKFDHNFGQNLPAILKSPSSQNFYLRSSTFLQKEKKQIRLQILGKTK